MKKMRPHQLEGAAFMLNCLKGKTQIKSKGKIQGGADTKQPSLDNEDDDDFEVLPSVISPEPASPTPAKEFFGAILADEMGLGKTLQAIAVLSAFVKVKKRGVIVCPSSLIENWRNEIKKWCSVNIQPLMITSGSKPPPVEMVKGFKSNLKSYVMIISYDLFRKHIDEINATNDLEILICDEAHKLKNSDSTKTTAAMRSCRVKRRLLLTGSPVQNNLDELHALVSFACPGFFGSLSSFRCRYAVPISRSADLDASDWERKDGKNAAENLRFLLNQMMLRRTQQEILKKVLPPRTDVVIFLGLAEMQKKEYDSVAQRILGGTVVDHGSNQAAEDCRGEGGGGAEGGGELVLSSLQNLRRIANYAQEASPEPVESVPQKQPQSVAPIVKAPPTVPLINDGDDGAPKFKPGKFRPPAQVAPIPSLKPPSKSEKASSSSTSTTGSGPAFDIAALLASSVKFQVLDAFLRILKETTKEKAVIVSHYTQTLEKIRALANHRGYEALLLQGNTPIDQRQALVDRYNRPSDPAFLFMLSSRAGGVGINLPGGSRKFIFSGYVAFLTL